MEGMSAHFDIIGCGPESIGYCVYYEMATVAHLLIEYDETPPVKTGIICSLNK